MSSGATALRSERAHRARGSSRLFASAAGRYWLGVFPAAHAAQRSILSRAEAIPDPLLRADALASHNDKGSNYQGLAALAILAPGAQRAGLARGLVAYQLLLDYLDGVSERPCADPVANGLSLHRAFEVALDPEAPHQDYYALAPAHDDGGYLRELIEECRAPLHGLPSYAAVREPLLRQARLCRHSQALNHALPSGAVDERVAEWAAATAAEAGLEDRFEWWELLAAAAASSLNIGALLALGSIPGATEAEGERVEAAYFPWASGLNALLDSLVDLDEDPEHASHIRRYASPQLAAERLGTIAAGARRRLANLPDAALHEAIFDAMGAQYLAQPEAWRPDSEPVSRAVYGALGRLALPALAVHVLRRRGRGAASLLRVGRRPGARL
jgi:tetraprenyl-beta-curcumene synthase